MSSASAPVPASAASATSATSFSLPARPHPHPHPRLPPISQLDYANSNSNSNSQSATEYRRASALEIPPFRPPAQGGPPRRLSTGGFPSVFTLPPGHSQHRDRDSLVQGLGIRGADTESEMQGPPVPAPAPAPAPRDTRKRKSDPQGYGRDATEECVSTATARRSHSQPCR